MRSDQQVGTYRQTTHRVPSEQTECENIDNIEAEFRRMTVTPDSSPRTAVHRGNSSDDDTSGVDNCKSTDDIISLLDSLRIGPDGPGVKVERDYDLKTKGLTLAHPQDELQRRGPDPGPESATRSGFPSYLPRLKSEPGLHPLQFPQWSYASAIQSRFAPSRNDSCQYWTKARQQNRLPQLVMEQRAAQERFYMNRLNKMRSRRPARTGDVTDGPPGQVEDLSQTDLETDFAQCDRRMMDILSDPYLTAKDQWSPMSNLSKETWSPLSNLQLTEVELAPESEQDIMLRDIEAAIVKHSPPHFNLGYNDTDDLFGSLTSYGGQNNYSFSNKPPKPVDSKARSEVKDKSSRKRQESDWREESKPSPPKMAATDPMYDKDAEEDNILHSLIIADANPEVVDDVLNCLEYEDGNILSRIIDEQNQLLRTPLFLAVMDCKPVIVQSLLDFGADPSIQGKVLTSMDTYELRSPLHLAAGMGDKGIQLLEILLGCERTNINVASESDLLTPLHIALKSHRVKFNKNHLSCYRVVQMLIKRGADTDMLEETTSKTPVMLAIETLDIDLIKLFLHAEDSSKQADIHDKLQAVTRGGDTPLHIAAGVKMNRNEKKKLLRILVKSGADSNAENNCKELPEFIASRDLWRETFKC